MNRDVLLAVCALITAGAVAVAVYALERQHKLTKGLEEERYSRMVAEESSQKSAAKLATLENQTKTVDDRMAKLKEVLDQEKTVNQDLKEQYDQLAKAKAELEGKLQAILAQKAAAGTK